MKQNDLNLEMDGDEAGRADRADQASEEAMAARNAPSPAPAVAPAAAAAFVPPPSREPPRGAVSVVAPSPVASGRRVHGSPDCPVKMSLGWEAGGLIKFALCRTNADLEAAGCQYYDAKSDLCTSVMSEAVRAEAIACNSYKPR